VGKVSTVAQVKRKTKGLSSMAFDSPDLADCPSTMDGTQSIAALLLKICGKTFYAGAFP
jgi:hypothetical protein